MRTIFFIFWLIGATSAGAQAISVSTQPFADVSIYPQRNAFATVISLNNSRISAEVTARIVEIPVEVGQIVRKGATLAQLDSRDYVLAAERAQASLESAQSTYQFAVKQLERSRKLVAEGFVSPQALGQQETNVSTANALVRTAKADLTSARRNVKKCLIKAPFKAIIKERLGQVGEIATPGAPLVRVLDASRIEVSARIQPADAEELRSSKSIVFESREERLPLKLRRIVPALDQRERSQEARLRFQKGSALPGAPGRVVWQSPQAHLPPDLVLRRGTQLGVFIAANGKALFVAIPQAQEGRPVPANIAANAAIIIDGRYQLQNGDAVTVAR
jgi:RND family efflux transporter MFP subunit